MVRPRWWLLSSRASPRSREERRSITATERWWESELQRLHGELLEQSGVMHEAEQWGQRAVATARQHGAKSLELRASVSLGRLWWKYGKQDVARQLLADIYGQFTERFTTADLQEARALLDAWA